MNTPHSEHSLEGKIAVIVGASAGLGKAIAEMLDQERVKVFALARTIADTELAESISRIPMNIRDVQSIDDAFAAIDAATDHIDILVNCAGRGLVKKFEDVTRDEIMDVFGTNLKGNIYTAQEVYKRMLPKQSGHIVNVVSTSGIKARPDETIYCASKWGMRGFTESLKLAAAPNHIRVTGVYPGGMQTDFWKGAEPKDLAKFMNPVDVAGQVVNILKTPPSISPSEYVIERGVE